ncbi:hypothetical protein Bca52824_018664 [Brassica carinata]|uniref:Uncharacterized protein n=1 Tax=Brassica carinata TaxID=52824 RepID=A0A8X7VQX0_BRACI|nr:hypothetical protein Bca52824_018664 [Brassica carinata]
MMVTLSFLLKVYECSGPSHSGVTEQKLEAETSEDNLALEADRDSMKQTILSMRTEKASMEDVSSEMDHIFYFLEKKGSSKQKHVWDVSKQHGAANASRKGPSITALTMSQ